MPTIRVLGLAFLAALALSAFASSSAQAGWLILGSLLKNPEPISLFTVTHEPFILHYDGVRIRCEGVDVQEGEIEEPDHILVGALLFLKCTVVEPTTCKLKNQPSAEIGTVPIEFLVTLDGPLATKAKVKPKTGEVFSTFKFEGGSCAITGKQGVTGTAEILSPEGQDERLWHLVNVLIAEEGELKAGEVNAEISGSTLIKLASDMLWSFV